MKEQINRKHQVVAWLDDYPYSRHVILDVSLVAPEMVSSLIPVMMTAQLIVWEA
jgi:hypothetical protein